MSEIQDRPRTETGREAARFVAHEVAMDTGTPFIIHPAGCREKFRSYFIGQERGAYLVAALQPILAEYGSDPLRFLRRGTKARIVTTSDGAVNSFESCVLAVTTQPFKHLYLGYPTDVEVRNLRMHDRANCHLPAVFRRGTTSLRGMVVNVSASGCALVVGLPDGREVDGICKGDRGDIRLHINLQSLEHNLECEVMSLRRCGCDKAVLGLRFLDVPTSIRVRLIDFIDHVLFYTV